MKKFLIATGIVFVGITSVFAGEWTVSKNPMGPGYVTSNGEYTINAPDERSATRVAKNMNKAQRKAEKAGKAFKPDDTGPCADPRSGVAC